MRTRSTWVVNYLAIAVGICICGNSPWVWGQTFPTGGGTGSTGGNTGTPGSGMTPTTGSPTTGNTGGGTGTGSSASAGSDPIDLTANGLNLGTFTNERIQPFVGASTLNTAHPRSFVAADGSGGGTSNFGGPGFSLSPGGQFGGQFGGNTGLGFGTGSSVPRRGIRGAITYDFADYSAKIEAGVAPYFVDRISRTPRFAGAESLDVTVENRVATLRGTVLDADQKKLLERQLLMEPGVSKVVNLLEIQQ